MDFLPAVPRDVPRQMYKTELTLSVGGGSRRGSTASDGAHGTQPTGRRMSLAALGLGGGGGGGAQQSNGKQPETHTEGVWYWPCLVGATDQNLVILPQTKPANPMLTRSPKAAKRSLGGAKGNRHSADMSHLQSSNQHLSASPPKDSAMGGKFMSGVRRLSTSFGGSKPATGTTQQQAQPDDSAAGMGTSNTQSQSNTAGAAGIVNDARRDSGAGVSGGLGGGPGEEDARETGWPGVVDGEALQAIVVPLSSISKASLDSSSKDGSVVHIGVKSAVNGKSGTMAFSFGNDWIGGKGEAEVLYQRIEGGVEKSRPMFGGDMFKLGSSRTHGADKQYNDQWRADVRGRW